MRHLRIWAFAAMAMKFCAVHAASPYIASSLWAFPAGGYSPEGPVTLVGGHIFGTAFSGGSGNCSGGTGCGTVFELTPSAQGWVGQTIHDFQGGADGSYPTAPLTAAKDGTLYSYTASGSYGTVYRLTPPVLAGTAWTFETIFTFHGGRSGNLNSASAGLILRDGRIYGIAGGGIGGACGTGGCGLVFRLDPGVGNGMFTETALYEFRGGADSGEPVSLAGFDASGGLYVTTALGKGAVVRVSPSSHRRGLWDEQVIATFDGKQDGQDPAHLVLGPHGVVYGAAYSRTGRGGNPVFSLTPPAVAGGAWVRTNLADVTMKGFGLSSMVAGANGSLVGVVYGDQDFYAGDAVQLTPPAASGAPWVVAPIWNFGRGPDTNPISITAARNGDFFGVLNNTYDSGMVFKLRPRP